MVVRMWMTGAPVTVGRDAALTEAAALMSRRRLRHLPVVDGGRLVGIVSAHDVARAFPPDVNPFSVAVTDAPIDTTVGDVMTTSVLAVTPDTTIEEAARLLVERRIGALPVVAGGRLVGLLSETDVLGALREVLGSGEPGVRVTFDATEHGDVIADAIALGRRHALSLVSALTFHHEGKRLAVVRLRGAGVEAFVDDVWASGHRVVSVVRAGALAG